MTLYVSIRRATLINNAKLNRNDPPFEIRKSKDDPLPQLVHYMEYGGTVRLIYDKHNPLVSGAVCWLEIEPTPQTE